MKVWHYNKDIGIEIDKSLGNTNTHGSISDIIIEDFVTTVTKDSKFLEPAVGSGSFYFSILNKLLSLGFDRDHIIENMIYAYDIDAQALGILLEKLKSVYGYEGNGQNVFNEDFLLSHVPVKFDYVITNPPYVSSKNIKPKDQTKDEYLERVKSLNYIDFNTNSDIYLMFYLKTLNLLTENGVQIFLCSDSWLDCEYGEVLKELLTTKYHLEYMVNSQLYPFFRDDTNAVITVIRPNADVHAMTHIAAIKTPMEEVTSIKSLKSLSLNRSELHDIFKDSTILNKRNILILHSEEYRRNQKVMLPYEKYFAQVKDLIKVTSTSLSQATLEKSGLLTANDGQDTVLFWQIQARVNKKPNYKNYIANNELLFKVKEDELDRKLKLNIQDSSVYMSGIIDRFPLIFYTEGKSFHVSKYFHLKSEVLNPLEICLSLNNIFSFYNMEMDLKEGTRKTLRVGEMGLTKEIKKHDLSHVKCIDLTKFSVDTRAKINEIGQKYQHKVIYNIEEALEDNDYLNIQLLIKEELGVSEEEFNFIKKELLRMYYFRMRNLKKLEQITQ